MSRRVLVAGGDDAARARLAALIDASFDVDVVSARGPLDALRKLPNGSFGLVVVIDPSPDGEAPALDLVRFLGAHALHGRTPVAWTGAEETAAQAARALGAHVLASPLEDADVRALVQDLLGIG